MNEFQLALQGGHDSVLLARKYRMPVWWLIIDRRYAHYVSGHENMIWVNQWNHTTNAMQTTAI